MIVFIKRNFIENQQEIHLLCITNSDAFICTLQARTLINIIQQKSHKNSSRCLWFNLFLYLVSFIIRLASHLKSKNVDDSL